MTCAAKFTFLKGPRIGEVLAHDFAADATVACMKHHLLHSFNALDPDSQAMVLVWQERCLKLTDDAQLVSTLGESCNITVNIVKKSRRPPESAVNAPACATASITEAPALPPTASVLLPPVTLPAHPTADELTKGSRVMITGLLATPEMNSCTGFICDAFNSQSGRWTVQIESSPPSRGSFRPINLQQIPTLNQATHWLDEQGHQCPKSINYTTQCPKGHSLVPVTDDHVQAHHSIMCRLCHRHTLPRLFCSVKSCSGCAPGVLPISICVKY